MRIFIGAFVNSPEIIEKYHNFQNTTKNYFSGKWVEDNNLHFTFHFLGELPDNTVYELKEKLKDYLLPFNEKLIIKSIDGFPTIKNPRQIISKIFSPSKKIYKLHSDIAKILTENKIFYDKKNYRPHMTLVRIKSLSEHYLDNLESFRFFEFGELLQFKVDLIHSQLTPQGPIYKIL